MRSLSRFSVISLSSAALFIISCTTILSVLDTPPKENKIVSDFRAHRTAYERVRTMLSEDKDVEDVAPWGIELDDSPVWKVPPDGGMSAQRYQNYLGLLKEIGARRAGQFGNPREISFGIWGSGWGGDTRHINVSWLEREPAKVEPSLEAFYRTNKPRQPSYVHIEGKWYLWADW